MTDWAKLKVVDLKAELKSRGLPQNGLKGELVARLEAADQEKSEPVESDDAQDVIPATGDEDKAHDDKPDDPSADAPVHTENSAPADTTPATEVPVVAEETEAAGGSEAPDPAQTKVETVERSESAEQQTEDGPVEPVNDNQESKTEPAAAPAAGPDPAEPLVGEKSAESGTSADPISESQKRKRRSASPQPDEEDLARKRARAEDAADVSESIAPAVRLVDEEDLPAAGGADRDEAMQDRPDANTTASAPGDRGDEAADSMDYARDIAPALHPATSALYINNLMRPLRPNDVRAHLANLATPPSQEVNDEIIVNFYLDQIRTHAFVVFGSISAASRARTALHDCVWPNESNRKALWVDFVPPEKIEGWIDMETSQGGRSGSRWEVVYEEGSSGTIEARLESGAISSSRSGPPPGRRPSGAPTTEGPNAIPVGPRGFRDSGPPTGPRAVRPGTGPGPRPPPQALDNLVERTRAQPSISYQMVSEQLAARRLANMQSFYTKDEVRDLGREINRYSFEEGDSFVDRGKEIFEGIRPPHRERGMGRERRGGRGGFGGRPPRRGPPPFRPRSDRYLPGLTDSRDDRRSRYGDDRGSYRPRDRDRR
ncbi:Apoptotic chromatin condensation inducer in the nucleus [Paramyrothecium foliicola]|nr:Apoptotic chromatin condensation inducer in the nucleus [Paramyrothecium foliicola]